MATLPKNYRTVYVNSILGGFSSVQYSPSTNSYHSSIGIDPDFVIGNGKTSGAIIPVAYQKFSDGALTGNVKFLTTNSKDEKVYAYCSDGKVISYDLNLANETLVGTPSGGAGNGMKYYNNYLYFATPTNVSRYGPLNSSPTLTDSYFTSLSLSALTDTTYPSINGVSLPNHPMHVHGDNFLYFGDFVSGMGYIHKIRTKKTTYEGDTNDGSAYGALILPFGWMPTAIESYATDIIVSAIQTTSGSVDQGRSALFLWNPTATTFYRGPIMLPDPLCTAMLNINGDLYIWSGNSVSGTRISKYIGGDGVSEIIYQEEGTPPFLGAVSSMGNRLCWGTSTVNPISSASVYAYGSKIDAVPKVLHNVLNTTSTGTNPIVTAILRSQQTASNTKRVLVAWKNDSGQGVDKLATDPSTYNCVFRSNFFDVGAKFFIKEIRIPLGTTLASGMSITPKLYFDDLNSSVTLNEINSTNYSGRKVIYKQPELVGAEGQNDFLLELNFAGTVACPVLPSLEIVYEFYLDENNN